MIVHVLLACTFKDSGFCFRFIYCRFDLIVTTAAIVTVKNVFVMQTRFVFSLGNTCHKTMGGGFSDVRCRKLESERLAICTCMIDDNYGPRETVLMGNIIHCVLNILLITSKLYNYVNFLRCR